MSWSLVETKALAIKAARGGGMPWGLAEEAGFAVHWLQARGLPGAEALVRLLDWHEDPARSFSAPVYDGRKLHADGPANPLALGAALMDTGSSGNHALGTVCQPLLLAPFIAECPAGGAWKLSWSDAVLFISHDICVTETAPEQLLAASADCIVEATEIDAQEPILHTRIGFEQAKAIARLGDYAARTYAPATDASRLAGAGAGLTDND